MELLGWLENWGPDIKWWDNNMPGNCLMGCFSAAPYLEKITPYSSVNYGFSFLTKLPDPDQVGCGTDKPAGPCPAWDGENVYLAKASMQGSIAVSSSTTIEEASPSIVAIAEVVRMARMHVSELSVSRCPGRCVGCVQYRHTADGAVCGQHASYGEVLLSLALQHACSTVMHACVHMRVPCDSQAATQNLV